MQTTLNEGADSVLRAAREAKGLGLRELARRLGVDPSYLSRVERGLTRPSTAVLHKLTVALKLSNRTVGDYLRSLDASP